MFHLACKIPAEIVVAVSGGPDSQALLSFCQQGRRKITVLHVDHKTPHAVDARTLVESYCQKHHLNLVVREVSGNSWSELEWRNERLQFYKEFTSRGLYVATGHQCDDLIEWYLFTAIHGKAQYMTSIDEEHKLIKPFLYTEKSKLIEWCKTHDVPYIIDPTNEFGSNARAILRREVIPALLKVHPGLKTSIKNKGLV